MSRAKGFAFIAGLILAVGVPAHAVIGAIDPVPAATLLLPFFEVDSNFNDGITTLFTVTNTNAAPAIAHVTLWTDYAVPTFAFNISLTGYDVQSVNIRDVFNGFVPGLSGPVTISSNDLERIVAAHSGQLLPSTGQCAARDYGDGLYRGYITVDSVAIATSDFPNAPGYFVNGGFGIADNRNVLWGEYSRIDPANNFASGDTMVHIEADGTDPRTSNAGSYTFYGAFGGWMAADNREPLATEWLVPFQNTGDAYTDLIYWRDLRQVGAATICGAFPIWFPLEYQQLTLIRSLFQLQNPNAPFAFGPVCGRVSVNSPDLPTTLAGGFMIVNLDHNRGFVLSPAQSFVTYINSAEGRFSTESMATVSKSSITP